jgi:hypothetical protein
MEAEGWSPDDVVAAVEFCNEAMVRLMDKVAAAQEREGGAWEIDEATQSVLLWMDAVMRDPGEGELTVSKGRGRWCNLVGTVLQPVSDTEGRAGHQWLPCADHGTCSTTRVVGGEHVQGLA